ncbi:hypothetical protein PR048_008181 [Dryococelus australis]|uniref:Uncharacterized protein n=1 Tax=Dryococelus australis TaxID=614101 RepID=A0ABQ9HWD6_9NEOP|nr:hypothetical protein PR048_008181 [Dryococelus australis]
MQGRGKREVPENTCRPVASSGTIPTCENPDEPSNRSTIVAPSQGGKATKINKQQEPIDAEQKRLKQVVEIHISGENHSVFLEGIFQYRITLLSLSLCTAGGQFYKPIKSTFLLVLNLEAVHCPPEHYVLIDDGMVWNKVPPAKIWTEFALALFLYVGKRHAQAAAFHLFNDVYDEDEVHTNRRNCSAGLSIVRLIDILLVDISRYALGRSEKSRKFFCGTKGMLGRTARKREIPEKTHRTAATSDTFSTGENPGATPPGIESDSLI